MYKLFGFSSLGTFHSHDFQFMDGVQFMFMDGEQFDFMG